MGPIFESEEIARIDPGLLDGKLSLGWRHFGTHFFRSNFAIHDGVLCGIVPLRIVLQEFRPTKTQRRILRKNSDLDVMIEPASVTDELNALFDRHKRRFLKDVPASLFDFLSLQPASVPCINLCFQVRSAGRLVAASFLDVGAEAISGVYAMFDPAFSKRSPGILTMLLEIEYGISHGKRFYYSGYSYSVPSPYDYKKRFPATQAFDWNSAWITLPADFVWSRDLSALES